MWSRLNKRLPIKKLQNHANCGDTKGRRIYVLGTVNEIKRILDAAGVTYKKIRHSGFNKTVEVIFTHNGRFNSPTSVLRDRRKWSPSKR